MDAERGEWLADVRHLQAMLHEATDGELSCEDICQMVCAGPCVGAPFGGYAGRSMVD